MQDQELKQRLDSVLQSAIAHSVCPSRHLEIKHAGGTHASETLKNGWYVFIENFNDLLPIKKTDDDRYTRFLFRAVTYKEDDSGHFQVLVWHPSIGNQDQIKLIFEEEIENDSGKFHQFMVTAINLTSIQIR